MQKKYRFLGVALFGIVSMAALYIFSVRIDHVMLENARSRMVETAEHNASSIYGMFEKDINLLEKASTKWGDMEDFSSAKSIEMLQSILFYTDFVRLGLDSPDGTSYTSDGEIVDVSHMEYLEKVMRGTVVLTEVMDCNVENQPCFSVVVPIYRDEEVVGAVRGVYLANSLAKSMELMTYEGKGYCNLVDSQGNYLFKSPKATELYDEKNIFEVYSKTRFREGFDSEKIRKDLVTGKSAFSIYEIAGEFRCVYYTPVGINDWYVLTSVPVDYLTKLTDDVQLATALLLAVLVSLSAVQILSNVLHNRRERHRITEERDYLGHILDSIPLPIFITDTKRRLELVNDSALKLLGGTRDVLLGQSCSIWNTCICGTKDCAIEKLERTGAAHTLFSMNGSDYQVNTAMLESSTKAAGGFIEVFQDITEIIEIQKELEATIQRMEDTEKELMITEERYRIATENTRDIIIDYDFNSRIMFHTIQATEIYGVIQQVPDAPESLIELGVVSEKSAEVYLDMFRKMSDGEQKVTCVLLARTAAGGDIWNRINFTAIFDSDHKPARAIGIIQDITREKEAQLRYEREAHYRNLTVQDAALYYEVDLTERRYLAGHEKVQVYLQEPCDDYDIISGILLEHLVFPDDREQVYSKISMDSLMKTYQSGERKLVFQYRRIMADSGICWVESTFYLFSEKDSSNIKAICYIRDISAAKELELDLRNRAERDLLTGLYNKLTTESKVANFISSAYKEDTEGAFFLIDLDDFKKVNDTFGHDMGDFVLAETARRLQAIVGPEDIVGRLGGDEFAVFLEYPKTMEQVISIAGDICESLQIPYSGCGNTYVSGCSIGISIFAQNGISVQQLYKRADIALYQSKAQGKGTFTIFEAE